MVGEILSPGEAQALKCLYASMPVSDAVDYPAELFEAFARHGAFLWEKGPFAGRVPERLCTYTCLAGIPRLRSTDTVKVDSSPQRP